MKYLRGGLAKYDDYLGFGDLSPSTTSTPFTILSPASSTHQANLHAALNTAPLSEPQKIGVVSLELTAGQYAIAMLSRHIGKKIQLIQDPVEAVAFVS